MSLSTAANVALALDLLVRYTTAAQTLSNLILSARNRGTDITPEELYDLAKTDDMARQQLDETIAAARLREAP
jgi:hypothetical protein